MKTKRHAALVELIQSGSIHSHEDAVKLLAKRGITVTQATVSRDLEEVGAAKIRTSAGDRYDLLPSGSGFGVPLHFVLKEFVISLVASANTVVIKTPPGHANVVAAALDRSQLNGILGTIAGDDTLFVCTDEKVGGKGIVRLLNQIAEDGTGNVVRTAERPGLKLV